MLQDFSWKIAIMTTDYDYPKTFLFFNFSCFFKSPFQANFSFQGSVSTRLLNHLLNWYKGVHDSDNPYLNVPGSGPHPERLRKDSLMLSMVFSWLTLLSQWLRSVRRLLNLGWRWNTFSWLTDHLFLRKPNSLKVRKSKFWTAVISSWSWTRARTIKGTYSILLHFLPTVNILQDVVSISCHRRWGKTSDIWLTNNYISIMWSFIFYMAFTKYIKQLGRNKDNKNVWK